MRPSLHSLALLGLSPSLVLARGHDDRGFPVYGDHSVTQPGVTVTVTTTKVSVVTVEQTSWSVIYIPTTATVHAGCSASEDSSVSGIPISSHSSHGPWVNSTSTEEPCPHGWPTSTPATAPGNFSTSLGWNYTMPGSRQTLTGTAGATIESVDPIGTTSAPWVNSTRASTTEEDSTSFLTLTVTSSAIITVNATTSSGRSGPTAPSSGYGIGTGLHNSTAVPTPYQPSLTYQTTEVSSTAAHLPINGTSTPLPSQNSSTQPWTNTTLTATQAPNTNITTSAPQSSSPSTTTAESGGAGDQYGSYTYDIPSPSSSSSTPATSNISTVESVDPIEGTSTATTFLTTSRPASASGSGTGSSMATTTTTTAGRIGGGYGYVYY